MEGIQRGKTIALNDTQLQHFTEIKKIYPNIPDATLAELLQMPITTDTEQMYRKLRYAPKPYDADPKEFQRAMAYAYHDTDGIRHSSYFSVFDGREYYSPTRKGWEQNSRVKYHIGFNTRLTADLFRGLDNVMLADRGKYIHYYKFIKYTEDYRTRHDTIIMYLFDRNPTLEQKIVSVAAPYGRSNDGLVGDIMARGIAITPETSNRPEYDYKSVGEVVTDNIRKIMLTNQR